MKTKFNIIRIPGKSTASSSLVWDRYEAEVQILRVAESGPTKVRKELKEIRGTDPEADRVKATIRDLSSRQGIFKKNNSLFQSCL
jgi:hypothetical protein